MVNFHVFALSFLLTLPSPAARPVESAFLQNSPDILKGLLWSGGTISIFLPAPLSLADQASPDQAFLIFKRIFADFTTTEFTTDPRLSRFPGSPGGILRARWSFRNRRTGNHYPFRIFFLLAPEETEASPAAQGPVVRLRIVEIRAEKL